MIQSGDVYSVDPIRKTAIRLVKKQAGMYGLPEFNFEADFDIQIASEPNLCYEVPNEYVVYVKHELRTESGTVHGSFRARKGAEISAIIFEKQYLHFDVSGETVSFDFDVAGLTGSTSTLSIHTLIEEPGLRIRLEHNHPGRKAGMYHDSVYPAIQIQAAHHYIMAMREIVRMLDIPAYLTENNLGYMYVLGFETNNEIHTDYPPHWHLIYRWANYVGSQAPHLYLGEDGATTHNKSYIDGIPYYSRTFGSDEWCKFVDCNGHDVCALCVQSAGGVLVTKPGGDVFRMSNFTDGKVTVFRNGVQIGEVTIANQVENGIYEMRWTRAAGADAPASYLQRIVYDPLIGVMLENEIVR